MSNRPQSLSVKNLSAAVDKAISVARDKHNVQFQPGFQIGPGLIMGRWLAEVANLETVQEAAQTITAHVNAGGGLHAAAAKPGAFEPVVLSAGNRIICGFWPGPPAYFQE